MNPTKSAAPIPKIHRVALVDNDPRALESLSLLIEAKVPTAYVVWTATSGHFIDGTVLHELGHDPAHTFR